MKRRSFLLQAALAAATARLAHAARRQNPPSAQKIIATKDAAYFLGKIEPVVAQKVMQVTPAPSGRWALFAQIREDEEKLWLYDSHRKKLTLLARLQDDLDTKTFESFAEIRWFPDAPKAVVALWTYQGLREREASAEPQRTRFGFIDAQRGAFRLLGLTWPLWGHVENVPGTPVLLLIARRSIPELTPTSVLTTHLAFVRPTSALSPISTVNGDDFLYLRGTSANRESALFYVIGEGKVKYPYYAARLTDAQVTPLAAEPAGMLTKYSLPKGAPLPLTLHEEKTKLSTTTGLSAPTTSLWLTPTEARPGKRFSHAFITAEASGDSVYVLLPDLTAVLFNRDSALYCAPITRLSPTAFDKLQQELAMANALEIGRAVLAYVLEQEASLPKDIAKINKYLLSVLDDKDALSDFVYTYKGTLDRDKILNSEETPLGYIAAPGGRAIFYADHHVEWKPIFRIVPPSDGG